MLLRVIEDDLSVLLEHRVAGPLYGCHDGDGLHFLQDIPDVTLANLGYVFLRGVEAGTIEGASYGPHSSR